MAFYITNGEIVCHNYITIMTIIEPLQRCAQMDTLALLAVGQAKAL